MLGWNPNYPLTQIKKKSKIVSNVKLISLIFLPFKRGRQVIWCYKKSCKHLEDCYKSWCNGKSSFTISYSFIFKFIYFKMRPKTKNITKKLILFREKPHLSNLSKSPFQMRLWYELWPNKTKPKRIFVHPSPVQKWNKSELLFKKWTYQKIPKIVKKKSYHNQIQQWKVPKLQDNWWPNKIQWCYITHLPFRD